MKKSKRQLCIIGRSVSCVLTRNGQRFILLYVFSVAKIMQHLFNAEDNHITKYFIQFKNSLNLFFDNNIYVNTQKGQPF